MAWTSPATVTTGQLMTAAFWNQQVRDNVSFLKGSQASADVGTGRTFTNTSYLDVDALTGGAGSLAAVAVTVDTSTAVVVHMSSFMQNQTVALTMTVSYRISGATTRASDDDWSLVYQSPVASSLCQLGTTTMQTGLTPGSNTFELQAKVSGGTGQMIRPYLIVVPI